MITREHVAGRLAVLVAEQHEVLGLGPRHEVTWLGVGVGLGLIIRARVRVGVGAGVRVGLRVGVRVKVGVGVRVRVRPRHEVAWTEEVTLG